MAKVGVHMSIFNVEPTASADKHDVLPSLARERLKVAVAELVEETMRAEGFPNARVTVR